MGEKLDYNKNKQNHKHLDGYYTRMLRVTFNIHWDQHLTNRDLYGSMCNVTEKVRRRRQRFARHCYKHQDEIASRTTLLQPAHGKAKRGRTAATY